MIDILIYISIAALSVLSVVAAWNAIKSAKYRFWTNMAIFIAEAVVSAIYICVCLYVLTLP